MSELAKDPGSIAPRAGFQLGLFGALLIGSSVAGLAAWLLFLPARTPTHLLRSQLRPELLDKPHRHRAAPESSPAPAAH